jgi:predicted transcriptional regulator
MAAEKIKKNPLSKPRKLTKSKASKKKISDLVIKQGLTHEETAQIAGVCRQRISQIISEAKTNPENILFKDNKDSAFEGLQAKIINLTSDEDIKKANLQQKIWSIGVLEDKIRNIRGLATEIHDVQIRALIAQIQPTQQDKIADDNDSNDK